jgi:hypothetical protein
VARGEVAKRLRAGLPAELEARLQKKRELKGLAVEVEALGNAWRLVAIVPQS